GRSSDTMPPEPFRQLWYASAEMTLENLRIDPIQLRPEITEVLAADVPASGARLFAVKLPAGHSLALGVNGTPLLQMSVFAADGRPLSPRGPLRVVSLGQQQASPVQLLVSNEGVAPARISLSLRADPPVATAAPAQEPPGAPGELPDRALPSTTPSAPPERPAARQPADPASQPAFERQTPPSETTPADAGTPASKSP
ncbi:MAG: serine/threonine protein kinase, partial [Cyanobium sp.]